LRPESVSVHARIEELNFERVVGDRALLADQLIEPLSVDHAAAIGVGVGAVIGAG
jgi:hypothetical protein